MAARPCSTTRSRCSSRKRRAAPAQKDAPTRDFIADAFAHCKFIGYTEAAQPLLEKAGIADALDEGCVALDGAGAVEGFVEMLGQLRFWDREAGVDLDAGPAPA